MVLRQKERGQRLRGKAIAQALCRSFQGVLVREAGLLQRLELLWKLPHRGHSSRVGWIFEELILEKKSRIATTTTQAEKQPTYQGSIPFLWFYSLDLVSSHMCVHAHIGAHACTQIKHCISGGAAVIGRIDPQSRCSGGWS